MKEPTRLLAVAAGFGRVGYVFLINNGLTDWGVSRAAGAGPVEAAAQAMSWFEKLRPEVVVTERFDDASRKRQRSRDIVQAIADAAAQAQLYDVSVRRRRPFPTKHDEAEALARRFPEIASWLPRRRRPWDAEPKNLIYFEALALAVAVIEGDGAAPT